MRIDISGRFFIGGVLVLISTIAYPSQIFVFYGPLGGWTWSTAKVLVPLNILVAMVFYNYYLSCSTDPGRIPSDWVSLRENVKYLSSLASLRVVYHRNLRLLLHNRQRKASGWVSLAHDFVKHAMYLNHLDHITAALVVAVS